MADDNGAYETPSEGLSDTSANEEDIELSENLDTSQTRINLRQGELVDSDTNSNPAVNKRKIHDVRPSTGPDSPDISAAPFLKKRLTEGGAGTSNIEKTPNRDGPGSDDPDFDTDDNLPLPQYGSSMGNDRDPVVTDGRRKAKPNMLRRALHNRARRRLNRPHVNYDTDTDEVPTVKPRRSPAKLNCVRKRSEIDQTHTND